MKTLFIIGLCLLTLTSIAFAQSTSPGLNFGVSGGAMGVYLKGQNYAGSVSTQYLTLTPSLAVEASQYVIPPISTASYFGGIRYAFSPTIFNKTSLPANTLQLTLHAAPGIVTSPAPAHFSAFAGAEIDYAPMSDGKFQFGPRVDALYLGNSQVGLAYSANIKYVFGGTTPTAAARARAALKKR